MPAGPPPMIGTTLEDGMSGAPDIAPQRLAEHGCAPRHGSPQWGYRRTSRFTREPQENPQTPMTTPSIEHDLKASIRTIPDYPKPGIMFRDITTLLGNARAFRRAVDELVQPWAG